MTELIPIVGGLLGALAFLFELLTKYYLNKRLKKYESDLDKDLQNHKRKLDQKMNSHLINLTAYHNRDQEIYKRRIDVLEEMHVKLTKLEHGAKSLVQGLEKVPAGKTIQDIRNEKNQFVQKSLSEFAEFYFYNKIYIQEEICDEIIKLIKEYREAVYKYNEHYDLHEDYGVPFDSKRAYENLKESQAMINNDAEEIRKRLEKYFRNEYQIEDY